MDKDLPKKGYWYFITSYVCVLCTHERIYKERRYTRRPKRWDMRHEEHETACAAHF